MQSNALVQVSCSTSAVRCIRRLYDDRDETKKGQDNRFGRDPEQRVEKRGVHCRISKAQPYTRTLVGPPVLTKKERESVADAETTRTFAVLGSVKRAVQQSTQRAADVDQLVASCLALLRYDALRTAPTPILPCLLGDALFAGGVCVLTFYRPRKNEEQREKRGLNLESTRMCTIEE